VLCAWPQWNRVSHSPLAEIKLSISIQCSKTTTMLYKMLLVEADYEISKEGCEETPKRRQLFVTQSRILAEKVEEHFTKLSAGYRPSGSSDKAAKAKTSTGALLDIDDEVNWRSDLPKRYSELRDEHFPLFVTFDRVS
jgi:hypothetical protein